MGFVWGRSRAWEVEQRMRMLMLFRKPGPSSPLRCSSQMASTTISSKNCWGVRSAFCACRGRPHYGHHLSNYAMAFHRCCSAGCSKEDIGC